MGDPAALCRDFKPAFEADGTPVPPFTESRAANKLLGRSANAFLIGLVLDQQIPMARAWMGPYLLKRRLGHLNPKRIAAMPEEEFLQVMSEKPAVHRFPKSMGRRVQQACAVIAEDYGGKADNIWRDQPDAATVLKRIGTVPGIGKTKQGLAIMILGYFYGLEIPGWREAAPVKVPA